jgi:hypothetical protein
MQSPEKILTELFDLLPDATFSNGNTAKIDFSWGSQQDLNKYIKLKGNKRKYPLIWLVNTKWNENRLGETMKSRIRLILAINSTKMENINPTIWDSDFEVTLNPIKENVLTALTKSGRTILNQTTIDIERLPNYSEEGTNNTKTIDVWNAIVIDCDVEISHNSTCFNQINF